MEKKEPLATKEEYAKTIMRYQDIPLVELVPGQVRAHILSSKRMTAIFVVMDPNAVVPVHKHEPEQVMLIVDGEAELVTGGKRYPVKTGDVAIFASYQEHGTYASAKGLKTIEFFAPVRQDYIEKLAAVKKKLGK
jgi:quercetin dioxygenase-like cupin family protein